MDATFSRWTIRPNGIRASWPGPARAEDSVHHASEWLEERKAISVPVNVGVKLFERDRDAFGSVLGSAIALRLFLFFTALTVAVVTGLAVFLGTDTLDSVISNAGVAGQMASEVEHAATESKSRSFWLFLVGLFLCLSAGRSLTRVLAACSAGASGMEARKAKATMRVAGRVTALISLLIMAGILLTRLRDAYGPAVAASSLAANTVVLAGTWFFVCLALPRATRDPGAALPGAVVFGLSLTVLQWFMHFYLPKKIENASEVMGSLGVTFATLGYLFFIGRIMAGTLVLNAVLFEQLGSISELVFELPLIRRIPARFPKVAAFFDLPPAAGDDPDAADAAE